MACVIVLRLPRRLHPINVLSLAVETMETLLVIVNFPRKSGVELVNRQ